MQLMEQLKAENMKVDCLFTDIPYSGVNRASNGLRNLDKGKADEATFDLHDFLKSAEPLVNSTFIIFCGHNQVSDIFNYFENGGGTQPE